MFPSARETLPSLPFHGRPTEKQNRVPVLEDQFESINETKNDGFFSTHKKEKTRIPFLTGTETIEPAVRPNDFD
jgi:hypothetical protein